jgi:hypothetical protein
MWFWLEKVIAIILNVVERALSPKPIVILLIQFNFSVSGGLHRCYFVLFGTEFKMPQHNILEDMALLQHNCENLKS